MGSAVVTLGETMALFTSPETGPLRHAGSLDVGCAGAESNLAIGVRRLGLTTSWMGRVGDDEFGRMVLARLRGEGVDVDASTVDGEAPTGLMFKSRRTGAATQVIYYRRDSAASRMRPEHLDHDRIRRAAVFHVSGITPALSATARETVFAAVETARSAGVVVSVDPNYRAALWPADVAADCFRDLCGKADVVLAGDDEAAMMYGDRPPGELARALFDAGAPQAVVKLGARGAVACIDGEEMSVDAVAVNAIDPVGAGDGFGAGYLTGLVQGQPPVERLRLAAAVGAFATTVRGDWEGLPSRDELGLLEAEEGAVHR